MIEINNRKARYDFEIIETIECGIELKGTEVKSIKKGNANIKDSYAIIKNGECFLLNMHINHYEEGNQFNHEETRTRKLLLHKNEILKINDSIRLDGYTLIPLKIYFLKNKAKVLIGIAKGKKQYDKREDIKKRDIERELRKKYKNN